MVSDFYYLAKSPLMTSTIWRFEKRGEIHEGSDLPLCGGYRSFAGRARRARDSAAMGLKLTDKYPASTIQLAIW
jgi:hypothetical protein